jgi:O-antigen biosynthesis protein
MESQQRRTNMTDSLEPTGERYLPWADDPIMAYEHLHRYAYVSRIVQGKRVLDLACGEGYGSALLARSADSVVGIDIDRQAVHHARAKYAGSNVHFVVGSITEIPLSGRFDVIVCFEVLEHINEQDRLLSEVKRLLKPEGLLVISTPNKSEYRKLAPANPFHLKELDFDEFRTLLARFFDHAQFLGQRVHCGSSLSSPDRPLSGAVSPLVIDRNAGEFVLSRIDPRPPVYFIGIASDVRIPLDFSSEVMVDGSDSYLKEMARIQRELEETTRSQEEALSWREEQARQFQSTINSHEQALAWRASQIDDLHDQIRDQQLRIRHQQLNIDALAARMHALETSRTWLFAQRFYRFRDRVFPPQSFRRRIYDRLIGKIKL